MKDILISVCCITYNQASFIRRCLDGVLMQRTGFDIEILINDDASTDGTIDIIREYERRFPEIIKPIYQNFNQYSMGQRGMNIKYNFPRARGKYISLCEGDDYWTDPLKLQKQFNFLESNLEYGLVHSDSDILFQKNGVIVKNWNKYKRILIPDSKVYEALIVGNFIKTCTTMFRVELIPKNLTELMVMNQWSLGDKILWLSISSNNMVKYFDESTAVYRVNEESASQTNDYKKNSL